MEATAKPPVSHAPSTANSAEAKAPSSVYDVVTVEIADLDEYPGTDPDHTLDEYSRIMLGDGHGNVKAHVRALIYHKVLEMNEDEYEVVRDIYNRNLLDLSAQEVEATLIKFEEIIMRSIPPDSVMRRGGVIDFMGDDFADRGKNDVLMKSFKKALVRSGVYYEAEFSNHDELSLHNLAQANPDFRSPYDSNSLFDAGELLLGKPVRHPKPGEPKREPPVLSLSEFKKDMHRYVIPFYTALGYTIRDDLNPPVMTLHNHAPTFKPLQRIRYLADLFNVPYRKELFLFTLPDGAQTPTPHEYATVIDKITKCLVEHLKTKSPRSLYERYLKYLDDTCLRTNSMDVMNKHSLGSCNIPFTFEIADAAHPETLNLSLLHLIWQRGDKELEEIIANNEFPDITARVNAANQAGEAKSLDWAVLSKEVGAKTFPELIHGIRFIEFHGHDGSLERFCEAKGIPHLSPSQSYLPNMVDTDRELGKTMRTREEISKGKYHAIHIKQTTIPKPNKIVATYRKYAPHLADLILDIKDYIDSSIAKRTKIDAVTQTRMDRHRQSNAEQQTTARPMSHNLVRGQTVTETLAQQETVAGKISGWLKAHEKRRELTREDRNAMARDGKLAHLIARAEQYFRNLEQSQQPANPAGAAGEGKEAADAPASAAAGYAPATLGMFGRKSPEQRYKKLSLQKASENLARDELLQIFSGRNSISPLPMTLGSFANAFKQRISDYSAGNTWHQIVIANSSEGRTTQNKMCDLLNETCFGETQPKAAVQNKDVAAFQQALLNIYASYFLKSIRRNYRNVLNTKEPAIAQLTIDHIQLLTLQFESMHIAVIRNDILRNGLTTIRQFSSNDIGQLDKILSDLTQRLDGCATSFILKHRNTKGIPKYMLGAAAASVSSAAASQQTSVGIFMR